MTAFCSWWWVAGLIAGAEVSAEGLPYPEVDFFEEGPQEYVFTCDYRRVDAKDRFAHKSRIQARYTRGYPGDAVEWDDASYATGATLDGPLAEPAQSLDYLAGFRYDAKQAMFSFFPGFFRDFPGTAAATYAKNLIWDIQMLERFARGYSSQLRLHEPLVLSDATGNVPLAGMGAFKNRRIELTWVGTCSRSGEECALLQYEAFFNRFSMKFGGSDLDGLSHYWGTIWVSLEDAQIEHATLSEHVSMHIEAKGREATSHRVLRTATLEKTAGF